MFATANADTLDSYIKKLELLRDKHGGSCPVVTAAGDYPEGAERPYFVDKKRSSAYHPEGCVVLA